MALENIIKDELKEAKINYNTYQFISNREKKPTLHNYKFVVDDFARVLLIGDEHIGSKQYLEEEHKAYLDWNVDHKSKMIHIGDMLECATRDSVGAGVYEQSEIIDNQIGHALDVYKEAIKKNLFLGVHIGNHEARVWKSSGLNITKTIVAPAFKTKYFGWGKAHYFLVEDKNTKKKQGYTMYTTHGASGARLPHTKIKGCLDLAQMIDVEIYGMGHTHQLAHHTRVFYNLNKQKKIVDRGQKHFILTGAYLGHWGSYAHVKNYEPMKVGSPKVKLYAKEHLIRVSE